MRRDRVSDLPALASPQGKWQCLYLWGAIRPPSCDRRAKPDFGERGGLGEEETDL